jgi:hypothetical protein
VTCPVTSCGFDAPDPIGEEEILACPSGRSLITLEELAGHPNGCRIAAGSEDLAEGIIDLVSSKIADYYGVPNIAPCLGARCFEVDSCGNVRIDPMLRVDEVELSSGCGCTGDCDRVYSSVELCDVVVAGVYDLPPWTGLKICKGAVCGDSVRVTGVYGHIWPIPPAIKAVAVMAVAKIYKSTTKSGDVITNREDGSLRFDVTEASIGKELALLPNGLFSYQWRAV